MITKTVLILLTVFTKTVSANCDDEFTCFCSDILPHYTTWWNLPTNGGVEKTDGSLFYSEGLGCTRNMTCRLAKNTYFYSGWDYTTIPKPNTDERDITDLHILAMDDANLHRAGEFANLQELFGIVCEDFKWYITKYPFGYSYMKYALNYAEESNEWVHVPASEIAGQFHKTELRSFMCSDEDCQRKEVDMCYYD